MSQHLPFSHQVFSSGDLNQTACLLPASVRTKDHTIILPTQNVKGFLNKDLRVERLNKINSYLWLAGRPMPPRPLNYQIATSRNIVVDERIDLHLVWENSKCLHLKPLPRYLLDTEFWASHLICTRECCAELSNPVSKDSCLCNKDLYRCALGFLNSYVALIQYESDLEIAHKLNLLPREMTWNVWVKLVSQLLLNGADDPTNINPRYLFGELRLSQLNKIYTFRYGKVTQGYQFTYQTYGELFRHYITPLSAATIYVALVLTAMQVGLATSRLSGNGAFQSSSYGFTVFAILGPLLSVFLVGCFGIFQFTSNMLDAWKFKRAQLARYGVLSSQSH